MSKKSGNEVKESIVLLCRMFKCSSICQNILPDHIRQAKFDKPEVISVLLHLLTALILDLNDERPTSAALKKVLRRLKSCRYPRMQNLCDESGNWASSREILLAIAWFMSSDGTIDRMRDEAMSNPDVVANMMDKVKQKEEPQNGATSAPRTQTLTDAEKSSHVNWAVSRIHFMVMQIKSLEVGIVKKRHQMTMRARTEIQEDPSLLFLLRHESLCTEETTQSTSRLICRSFNILPKVKSRLMKDSVLAAAVQAEAMPRKPTSQNFTSTSHIARLPLEDILQKKIDLLNHELQVQSKCHQENLSERLDAMAVLQPEQKAEIDREMQLIRRHLEDYQARPVLLHCPDGHGSSKPHHAQILRKTVPLSFELERLQKMNLDLEDELAELRLHAD